MDVHLQNRPTNVEDSNKIIECRIPFEDMIQLYKAYFYCQTQLQCTNKNNRIIIQK